MLVCACTAVAANSVTIKVVDFFILVIFDCKTSDQGNLIIELFPLVYPAVTAVFLMTCGTIWLFPAAG